MHQQVSQCLEIATDPDDPQMVLTARLDDALSVLAKTDSVSEAGRELPEWKTSFPDRIPQRAATNLLLHFQFQHPFFGQLGLAPKDAWTRWWCAQMSIDFDPVGGNGPKFWFELL